MFKRIVWPKSRSSTRSTAAGFYVVLRGIETELVETGLYRSSWREGLIRFEFGLEARFKTLDLDNNAEFNLSSTSFETGFAGHKVSGSGFSWR